MPARKMTPPKELLAAWRELGLTQKQMVDEWFAETGVRVSRSAIAMAMHRAGLADPAHERHDDLLPWTLRPEHRHYSEARYLRLESRRRRGLPIPVDENRRLLAWLDALRQASAVVYYEPETARGFWWVPREETDRDIIRKA